MIAIDTSVAVAALARWHAAHDRARLAASGARIPAHAGLETYSVMTRMPPPHRLTPAIVVELIKGWFPPEMLLIPSRRLSLSLVERCCEAGVDGGAVYDALVGLTAAESKLVLLTRDERAARTYRLLGVEFDLMS